MNLGLTERLRRLFICKGSFPKRFTLNPQYLNLKSRLHE
jgi:hypothetical protein